MKVHPITVREVEYEVELSEGGEFSTHIGDVKVVASKVEDLKEKVSAQTRRAAAKISVPFMMVITGNARGDRALRSGVITGVHGGNRNLMVQWGDGRKEQLSGWRVPGERMVSPMSSEEGQEYLRLLAAEVLARKAVTDFEKTVEFDARAAAEAAIAAAEALT